LQGEDDLKYEQMIGCSYEVLVKWFEYNFQLDSHSGMNWENQGTFWQIDHVYPLSKVENIAEDTFYCSWKNLRPIPGSDNAHKSAKIDQDMIQEQDDRVEDFEWLLKNDKLPKE
jgi:hypothetical protein